MSWKQQARCKGEPLSTFFIVGPLENEKQAHADWFRINELCGKCPVQQECLDYAVKNRIRQGIWGGKTFTQRRKYIKQQGIDRLSTT
jgi:WhiB family redox-sensing transcriptional regulator